MHTVNVTLMWLYIRKQHICWAFNKQISELTSVIHVSVTLLSSLAVDPTALRASLFLPIKGVDLHAHPTLSGLSCFPLDVGWQSEITDLTLEFIQSQCRS